MFTRLEVAWQEAKGEAKEEELKKLFIDGDISRSVFLKRLIAGVGYSPQEAEERLAMYEAELVGKRN